MVGQEQLVHSLDIIALPDTSGVELTVLLMLLAMDAQLKNANFFQIHL
jgi:hypothetical protein